MNLKIRLSESYQTQKEYILNNSIYMTFNKGQNSVTERSMVPGGGMGKEGQLQRGGREISGVAEMFTS